MHPKTAEAVRCVIRRPGLDVAASRAAGERAVARHPVLRTGFVLAGDAEPVQAEPPEATVNVTVHHVVLDDRSLAMLMTELDSGYEGRDYEVRPDFPARTHHRDFGWCTARTRQPAGVSGASPLPFGKTADATVGLARQTVRFALTGEETVALHRLADRESVTLHTVVLATTPRRIGLDPTLSVGEWVRDIRRYTGAQNPLSSLVLSGLQEVFTRHTAAVRRPDTFGLTAALREHWADGQLMERPLPTAPHTPRVSIDRLVSPGPDELWLTDAAGARYTAELRFVAVDRRGPASEGQS